MKKGYTPAFFLFGMRCSLAYLVLVRISILREKSGDRHYYKTGHRSRPKVPAAVVAGTGYLPIGTGRNSSWYLWPWTNLVEDNWHRVVVPTGSKWDSIGTGLNHHPVPNEGGAIGTG